MYRDVGLILATNDPIPHAGAPAGVGAIGAGSAALNLDLSSTNNQTLRNFNDPGSGQRFMLNIRPGGLVTTDTWNTALELQLISLPISLALLSNATTSGKHLHVAGAALTIATDTVTIAGHGLPLGTPVYLTSIAGGTAGVSANTMYFAVPVDANTFQLAASLDDALAATPVIINMITSNGTATVNFIPTIHGSTGALRFFETGVPVNQGPMGQLGSTHQVPLRPLAQYTAKKRLAAGQTLEQPTGGPGITPRGETRIGVNAQRYFALNYIVRGGATFSGLISAELVHDPGNARNMAQSAFEVIG